MEHFRVAPPERLFFKTGR